MAEPTQPVVRRKGKRQVVDGLAHIHASFNNTIIMITDRQGGALVRRPREVQGSEVLVKAPLLHSGRCGTAGTTALNSVCKIWKCSLGPGPGREAAVRALNACGFKQSIKDVTPYRTTGAVHLSDDGYKKDNRGE